MQILRPASGETRRRARGVAHAAPGAWLASLRRRLTLASLVWTALGAVGLYLVASNWHELRQITSTLSHADPVYLAGAAAIQAAFLANMALYYQSTFAATGLRGPLGRFALLGTASYFVNLVSKTGGLGGMVPHLSEGRRRGFARGRVITAYMLTIVLGHLAYFATLAVALVLLYLSGSLKTAEVIASAVIFGLLLLIFAALLFTVSSRSRLETAYAWTARRAHQALAIVRRRAREEGDAAALETAHEVYDAVAHVRSHPRSYALPFLHAILIEVLSMGVLFMVAEALGAHVGLGTIVAAYAISVLLGMAAVTPSGLGFVEAGIAGVLASFGVPLTTALAVSLAYRFFEFWVPFFLGFLSLRLLARPEQS